MARTTMPAHRTAMHPVKDESPPVPAASSSAWMAVRRRDQPFLEVLQDVIAVTRCRWVEVDPKRQHGRPVVAGTRLPLSVVLTRLAAGRSLSQIVEEFPEVTAEQLRGAVDYAAEVFDQDVGT